jgi:hypothetical protein
MKRLLFALALCGVAGGLAASGARADVAERDLRAFEKGKATYNEVISKLGPPAKSETNGEGLRAIAYTAEAGKLGSGAIFGFFGTADGVFMPGAPKSDAPPGGGLTAFVFDRYGRLMYYRATEGATMQVTSEDGAGPMPNVKITLDADQRQTRLPADDGKPHLGIQLVPVADLDAEHKQQFAAARFNGLVVANVIHDSPGEKAGIVSGDYLYALNGILVASAEDAVKAMATVKKGDTVVARVKRIDESVHLARETVFNLKF